MSPALRVLEWRYRDQLDWRLVLIGLTDTADQYVERGYTPLGMAQGHARYRRFGMPFSPQPRSRVTATGRACRAIVAARLLDPGSEWRVYRALQFAWFTTSLLLDEEADLRAVLEQVPGIDSDAILATLDQPDVSAAYAHDKADARTAAGSPAELQGKTAQTDGPIRFTAPSLALERDGQRFVAGGYQTIEAYDVLVANLDPNLDRRQPPSGPEPLLQAFSDGLTTQEVAALLTHGNDQPNPAVTEQALLELVADGTALRAPLADDALWSPAG